MKTNETVDSLRRSIQIHVTFGLVATVFLVIGSGLWASTTHLAGAVVSQGTFVVDSYVKKVQHPTGGIVGAINIRDGQRVMAGQVLMSLDATQTKAQLAIITKRIDQLNARRARLEAERDNNDTIRFYSELMARQDNADVAASIHSEERLFEFRREARGGKKKQLFERIAQYNHEIAGLRAQQEAFERGISVLDSEIAALRPLLTNGYVNAQRLNALETQAATFSGERGEKIAYQAQVAGKIAETELQILSIDQELKTEVGQELREIESQIGEFVERKIAAEDELKRIDIVAPQTGIVHQLTVHTVGGVISSADVILQIVPDEDELLLEVQIAPQDIDQIIIGQEALIRMTAFNQRTTPELRGKVARIGAELTHNEKTGYSWYLARIRIPTGEMKRLQGLKLLAGMPAEAQIKTGERTALSYFLKPLSDQVNRAFREE